MFEQSLMESAAVARSHRGLVTSLSALAQLTLLAIAVVLPMFFTRNPPLLKPHIIEPWTPPPVVPPPEPPPTGPSSGRNEPTSGTRPIVVNNPFPAIRLLAENHSTPEPAIPQGYNAGSTSQNNLPLATHSSLPQGPRTLIRSVLDEGRIIRRVQPEYPALAKRTGTEGRVVIEAIISRSGTIENVRVISGHPLLVRAAQEAVSQWQFRPYILNGTPVEVVTQITVDFKLKRE